MKIVLTIEQVLGEDFDGNPSEDFSEILLDGLDDPRHRERVPALIEILHGADSTDLDRFIACVALTTWAVPEGFNAVIKACVDPGRTRWLDVSIDRMYSVDNTFGQLAIAVRTSHWLAEENGSSELRAAAVLALVDVADRAYFDGQLEGLVRSSFKEEVVASVVTVVRRGLERLRISDEPRWDLATQLVDLVSGIAGKADEVAIDLTSRLVVQSPQSRLLRHAASILSRTDPAASSDLADLILSYGGDAIAPVVAEARNRRRGG